ncbi:MAG: wax ester/triacylglycerol synthase family O-acyltransferase [Pseudomonadales bacterium]
MKKLNVVDKGFLLAESREMPMHVGGVALYTLPEGANEREFLHELTANMRDAQALLSPFGDRLKIGRLGPMGPTYWEPDPALDMEYHVRHSALPQPGRYRELFTLVSRLHGTLLERSRPLWEAHIIEGLQNRQFAVYSKTHHAAVDGARSIHVARSMLSADAAHRFEESPLSLNNWEQYKASMGLGKRPDYSASEMRSVTDTLKASLDSGANIFSAVKGFANAWTGRSGDLALPHLNVPQTALNSPVDGARRFVAQSWPFARIKAVAKAFDGTFNDAVLAMCSGALRQYLQTHAELPQESLKAMVPVSLRHAGDVESGNAVAAISADLATSVADPAERFRQIKSSVQAGKDYYSKMSPSEIELFSMIMQAPSMLLMPLGLISRLPPYNVAISNVPGIQQTMYWNGARMDGSYPLSIVTDGMALNITLVTYGQSVDFGIIACRRSLPHVQRLIDYMEESLQELEDAAGLGVKTANKGSRTKRKSRVKTKAETKTKPAAKAKKPSTGSKKRSS